MRNEKRRRGFVCFFLGVLLLTCTQASADWETGAKVGFDSNVDRSVDNGKSDGYLTGYLSFLKNASGESRVDWTLATTLEGTAFAKNSDLDYASLTLAPGLTFIPHRAWTINLSPFVQGKAVVDNDQSAIAFGGKLSLRQQIGKDVYMGEYYIYQDSRANVDTYSFTENAIGAFLGVNWTRAFFTEIGYEFSRGDSFRTISTTSTTGSPAGRGKNRGYSTTFQKDIFREQVDRQAIGLSAGIDWTKSLFSHVVYTFTTTRGDSGTSTSHAGFVGIGYRF
jgi:hypothetical protein